MKERSPVKKNILKLIPYIEIIAGVIFLCLEIHDYRTLYSMAEADALYGGLADFCKQPDLFCLWLQKCKNEKSCVKRVGLSTVWDPS